MMKTKNIVGFLCGALLMTSFGAWGMKSNPPKGEVIIKKMSESLVGLNKEINALKSQNKGLESQNKILSRFSIVCFVAATLYIANDLSDKYLGVSAQSLWKDRVYYYNKTLEFVGLKSAVKKTEKKKPVKNLKEVVERQKKRFKKRGAV